MQLQPQTPPTAAAQKPRNILIVDDDAKLNGAMSILMSRAGLQPIICQTGAEALTKAGPQIAAAIVDIHLPDIDGLTLSQQLRQTLGPKTPIVILSGDNSIETLRALPDAGATSFFAKPVNGKRLIEHLSEALGMGVKPVRK